MTPPETKQQERTRADSPVEERSVPLEPERSAPRRSRLRRAKWILLAVVLVLIGGGYLFWQHFYAGRESTDDAQIDGHVIPVSAKVGGFVTDVEVNDNQEVKQGALLVQIDTKDYQLALDRARADLTAARSGAQAAQSNIPITTTTTSGHVNTAQASLESARAAATAAERAIDVARSQAEAAMARVGEAQANYNRAERDLARMKQLVSKDEDFATAI